MRRYIAIGLLILLLAPALMVRLRGEKAKPTTSEGFKNPLDVTVDEKGQIAQVVLTGTRSLAEVDLVKGRVIRETPWPEDKPFPGLAEVPVNLAPEFRGKLAFKDDIRAVCMLPPMLSAAARKQIAEARSPQMRKIAEARSLQTSRAVSIHQRAKFQVPATQIAQGWVFTHAIKVGPGFDLYQTQDSREPLEFESVVLDEPQRGVADPSDVIIHVETAKHPQHGAIGTAHGRHIFVACAGADTILAVEFFKLPGFSDSGQHGYYDRKYYEETLTAAPRIITARLLTQSNPRRLALSGDGKTLVASNYLSDSLTVIDAINLKVLRHIPLGGMPPNAVRRGEILFNSAKLTFQGQFTCASCHPNGGTDGLNWDLTRDGVGNFKNTKSLLGIRDTAPYGWLGSSPTLEDRIRGTLRTLHRYEPSDEEVSDLAAYLASLPPPKPAVVKEEDRAKVERGRGVFAGKGGCAACHSGPAFDDGKLHNLGTGGDYPGEDRFNTPSLRGAGGTAPYLHDGRAATLEEIFTKHNSKRRHGDAHLLSGQELIDLIAFLKSL